MLGPALGAVEGYLGERAAGAPAGPQGGGSRAGDESHVSREVDDDTRVDYSKVRQTSACIQSRVACLAHDCGASCIAPPVDIDFDHFPALHLLRS